VAQSATKFAKVAQSATKFANNGQSSPKFAKAQLFSPKFAKVRQSSPRRNEMFTFRMHFSGGFFGRFSRQHNDVRF
jgi:hypothetical protein